jgi:hypothetical protein
MNDLTNLEQDDLEFNDPPALVWVRVREAAGLVWEGNPKLHDVGAIVGSIERHGFQSVPKFDANLPNVSDSQGAIKDGNGRIEGLAWMENGGTHNLPRGLAKERDTGAWCMPLLVGTDAISQTMAEAYAIDANNLNLMGAEGVTPWDMARMYEEDEYKAMLSVLAEADTLPVSVDGDDIDALLGDIYERPDFEGIVEQLGVGNVGQSAKDGNWFYVEFYGDDVRYLEVKETIEQDLVTLHEIDRDAFFKMVMAYAGQA